MIELPRFALGSVQPELDLQDVLWGLLGALGRAGIDGQVFSAQSRFDDLGSLQTIDDRRLRHLDSWLMSPQARRWFLLEGGRERDLSIVVGRFAERRPEGGSLMALCQSLELPAVAVIDVDALDRCSPPPIPDGTSGLLLTGCRGPFDVARWQTWFDAIGSPPVLGGLCRSTQQQLVPTGGLPSRSERDVIKQATDDFVRHVNLEQLLRLARSAAPLPDDDLWPNWPKPPSHLRVAMAYDDAFHCYFPDTMDCLEAMGAQLLDFSPLKDESLPDNIDLVWIGCGHPERCPQRLSRNICLRQSIQKYVRSGGRVYAEGGGLAYICETLRCDAGVFPMMGILPAEASYTPVQGRAVQVDLVGRPWLGQRCVRGYLSSSWSLLPREASVDFSALSNCPGSLFGRQEVFGSRIHLHFASQPQLLQSIWTSYDGLGQPDPN